VLPLRSLRGLIQLNFSSYFAWLLFVRSVEIKQFCQCWYGPWWQIIHLSQCEYFLGCQTYYLEKLFLFEKITFITEELKETMLSMYNASAKRLFLVDLISPLVKYLKHTFILLLFYVACEPSEVCPTGWLPWVAVARGIPLKFNLWFQAVVLLH